MKTFATAALPLSLFAFLLLAWPAQAQQQGGLDGGNARMLDPEDLPQSEQPPPSRRTAALLGPAVSAAEVEQALAPAVRERLSIAFERVVAGEAMGLTRVADRERFQDFQAMSAQARPAGVSMLPRGQGVAYQAIVYTSSAAPVRAVGAPVYAQFDGFLTTRLTATQMAALAQQPSVAYITPGITQYPTNDTSVPLTGASLLHDGYIENVPMKGGGALICIIDSGLDYTHEDFLDEDGQSRVVSLWDQTLMAESEVQPPEGFDYGIEYTQEELTQAAANPADSLVLTQDLTGHGTHVAGTAAGDGSAFNGIYRGMAPEAELIIVKGGNGSFSETNIINGLTYCNERSNDLGRPMAVNLSLGGQAGPHDGTAAEEQVIDNLSQIDGQAVAVAAGNDGAEEIHVGAEIPAGGSYEINFEVPDYTAAEGPSNDFFLFDGWFGSNPLRDGEGVSVTVVSPLASDTTDARSVATLDTLGSVNAASDTSGTIFLANEVFRNIRASVPLGRGDLNTVVQVFDGAESKPPVAGTWTVTIENNEDEALRFDGWLYATSPTLSGATLRQGDREQTVAMPGTAASAITTGSFTSRKFWPANDGFTYGIASIPVGQIASSSGRGPTRDERTKPEISAPGQFVGSALSDDDSIDPQDDNDPNAPFVVDGGKHSIKSGTSMASPHVAGALALLLAESPSRSAEQLKDLLQRTATEDRFTGMTPTGLLPANVYGAGKLNVFRAMVQQKGGSTGERDRYFYAVDPEAPGNESVSDKFFTLTGEQKFALQFTPQQNGLLESFEVKTAFQSDGRPAVTGDGDLLYALYTDEGGLPGQPLTDTLRKPLAEIPASTPTRLSMIESVPEVVAVEDLRVAQEADYHVVFFTSEPGDTLQVSASGARESEAVRSAVFVPAAQEQPDTTAAVVAEGAWQEADDFYGETAAYEVAATVVRSDGVGVLPVELANFSVAREGNTALLRWTTYSETNNDRFEVLQKVDGAFEKVGSVESSAPGGTTSEPQSYEFRVASLAPGSYSFQLRQKDRDGTPSLSKVEAVRIGVAGAYELSSPYPNPFRGQARFDLSVAEAQDVQIDVFDALGRRVQTLHDGAVAPQKEHTFTLQSAHLSSGLYFVRVEGEHFSEDFAVTLVR